jgi:hypothetical protein
MYIAGVRTSEVHQLQNATHLVLGILRKQINAANAQTKFASVTGQSAKLHPQHHQLLT